MKKIKNIFSPALFLFLGFGTIGAQRKSIPVNLQEDTTVQEKFHEIKFDVIDLERKTAFLLREITTIEDPEIRTYFTESINNYTNNYADINLQTEQPHSNMKILPSNALDLRTMLFEMHKKCKKYQKNLTNLVKFTESDDFEDFLDGFDYGSEDDFDDGNVPALQADEPDGNVPALQADEPNGNVPALQADEPNDFNSDDEYSYFYSAQAFWREYDETRNKLDKNKTILFQFMTDSDRCAKRHTVTFDSNVG